MEQRWDTTLAVMRTSAALQPYYCPARLRDPGFCPLRCGFNLADDWDGHFFACLRQRAIGVWFTRR